MKPNGKRMSFYEVVTAAVADMARHGYDSQERVDYWMTQISIAAARDMTAPYVLEQTLRKSLNVLYRKYVDKGVMLSLHPGVAKFTLEKVKPKLRAELDRRIMASSQLIKLNREASIQKTLQRFSGWATSIPIGGSEVVDKNDVKKNVRKSLAQLPFEERRVIIDQGHKFVSSLSEILASDNNAIAGEWHSHWKQLNYNYRRDHKERDMQVYAVRGNWAIEKGLMKAGDAGYTDEITTPGEEVFCRCFYRWIYNLRDLPKDMLTIKGKEQLALLQEK